MNPDRQEPSNYGVRGACARVSMYNPMPEVYSPLSHNPPAPIRPGADAAFKCNSLDHAGVSRPYWANKE